MVIEFTIGAQRWAMPVGRPDAVREGRRLCSCRRLHRRAANYVSPACVQYCRAHTRRRKIRMPRTRLRNSAAITACSRCLIGWVLLVGAPSSVMEPRRHFRNWKCDISDLRRPSCVTI